MRPRAQHRLPPKVAEALLKLLLPDGVLGQSILGDLRQEYYEVAEYGISRFPRVWYWRTAAALGVRYAVQRLRQLLSVLRPWKLRDSIKQTTLLADLRLAARMLLKTPSVSLIAIFTIGLGVAICTHSFSSVYGSILRGLPVPGDDRLMYIDANRHDLGAETGHQ